MELLTETTVIRDIKKFKASLVKKAKAKGMYENFGQSEVGKLKDKYFDLTYKDSRIPNHIQAFNEWAMTYNGE